MVLEEYFPSLQPAYEVRRAQDQLDSTAIPPIAELGEARMLALRDDRMNIDSSAAPTTGRSPIRKERRRNTANRDAERRQRHPVELKTKVVVARESEPTEDGLPRSFERLADARTRSELADFVGTAVPEKRNYIGIDTGLVFPFTAYASLPGSEASQQRQEGVMLYSHHELLELQRRVSRAASHLERNLSAQYDRGMRLGEEETPPVDEIAMRTWEHVLHKWHPLVDGARERATVEREAIVRSTVAEFVSKIRAGRQDPEQIYVFFLGEETGHEPGGQSHGAPSASRLTRELPKELERQQMAFKIVLVPEYGTSQHCPDPDCVDQEMCRSR